MLSAMLTMKEEISEAPFKDNGNHIKERKHKWYCNATELSKNECGLKRKSKIALINWIIVCKYYENRKRSFCRLCLKEKLLVIKFLNQDKLLNKRSEYICKYR